MDIAKLRQKIREAQALKERQRVERVHSEAEKTEEAPVRIETDTAAASLPPPEEPAKTTVSEGAGSKVVAEAPVPEPNLPVSPESAEEDVDDYLDEGMLLDSRQHGPGDALKLLAFRLGDEEYAVSLTEMQEVLMFHDVTFVPRVPDYLLGITSLRGKVIPVIDLRVRLRIEGPEPQAPRVLVLKSKDEPVGARVDSVTGVIRTWSDEILPSLNTLSEQESRFISGVVRVDGRFVSILDLEEILDIQLAD